MAKRDDAIRSHPLKPETVRALEVMKEEIRQEDFREGLADAVRQALPAILNAPPPERSAGLLDRSLTPLEQLTKISTTRSWPSASSPRSPARTLTGATSPRASPGRWMRRADGRNDGSLNP